LGSKETPKPPPKTSKAKPPQQTPKAPDPEAEQRAQAALAKRAFDAKYPLHGIATHYLAQIFEKPALRSRIVGYMRRGATFRASAAIKASGCSAGFHEVPGKGYVCPSRGFKIGKDSQFFDLSPIAPALDSGMPYVYVRTQYQNIPQYWKIPSFKEEREALEAIRMVADEEKRVLEEQAKKAEMLAAEGEVDVEVPTQADAVDAPPPPGQKEETGDISKEPNSSKLPDFVRMRMRRGYYVSVDRIEAAEDGRKFTRTIRGAYIPTDAHANVTPPTMRGVILGGVWRLPVGIVFRSGVRGLIEEANGTLRELGQLEQHTPFILSNFFDRAKKHYVATVQGPVLRRGALRVAEAIRRPPGIPTKARWIHIKLSTQVLVAYEEERPVFATTISSGLDDHKTPTGIFQIQSKHISTTMDDETAPEFAYSIEDVPWTMYFSGNYAIHGAFWHDGFGRVRSHGCVNVAPVDARWLFQWSSPTMPAGWHGVFALNAAESTWIFIEE